MSSFLARPDSVRYPAVSTHPAVCSSASTSDHSSSLNSRAPTYTGLGIRIASDCRTWDCRPVTPPLSSVATWPSPRCSRSSVAKCHSRAIGSTGSGSARGEQRPTLERSRLGGAAQQVGGHGHAWIASQFAQLPSQSRRGSALPSFKRDMRRRECPRVRQGLRDTIEGEVVEQRVHKLRADRPERCRPSGEVPHPETPVPGIAKFADRLGREIGDSVHRLDEPPQQARGRGHRFHGHDCRRPRSASNQHEIFRTASTATAPYRTHPWRTRGGRDPRRPPCRCVAGTRRGHDT